MALDKHVFEVTWFDPQGHTLGGRAQKYDSVRVVAVDVPAAVKIAERSARRRGLFRRCRISDVEMVATIDGEQ